MLSRGVSHDEYLIWALTSKYFMEVNFFNNCILPAISRAVHHAGCMAPSDKSLQVGNNSSLPSYTMNSRMHCLL